MYAGHSKELDGVRLSVEGLDDYVVVDDFFGLPYIDRDEQRTAPIPCRHLHGGFEGTDTKFSLFFPEKHLYRGRFFQPLSGALGGDETFFGTALGRGMGGLEFCARAGGYMVETNQGHIGVTLCRKAGDDCSIYGHRASAESARFARHMAKYIYGESPRYGYVFGGSGGARRSVNCIENVDDVWDGAMPFMGGGSFIDPAHFDPTKPTFFAATGFSAMFNTLRLLKDKIVDVIDATEPGGSGNPFATLNVAQREVLLELYRMGFPRGGEFMIANPMGQIGLWAWSAEGLKAQDPSYWTDFWTKAGYVGHDAPHLVEPDRMRVRARVKQVVTAKEMGVARSNAPADMGSHVVLSQLMPPDYPVGVIFEEDPKGYALGASLKIASGQAAGRQLWTSKKVGDIWVCDGIGAAGQLRFTGLAVGDEIDIDNDDFLAFCYFHYHHLAENPSELTPFSLDGHPVFPQRPLAFVEPQMGPHFTGVFGKDKKMLFMQHLQDTSLWPEHVITYANAVAKYSSAGMDNFRLRWIERAEHIPMAFLAAGRPAGSTRLIEYQGVIEQTVQDLVNWVENGVAPTMDRYEFTRDGRLVLPESAHERDGIQAVISATTNGGDRADVETGETVKFRVQAVMPKDVGSIVAVEWDFEGDGRFPHPVTELKEPALQIDFSKDYAFAAPGTYFPSVRVSSHRQGDMTATSRLVQNIGRVRVVVS